MWAYPTHLCPLPSPQVPFTVAGAGTGKGSMAQQISQQGLNSFIASPTQVGNREGLRGFTTLFPTFFFINQTKTMCSYLGQCMCMCAGLQANHRDGRPHSTASFSPPPYQRTADIYAVEPSLAMSSVSGGMFNQDELVGGPCKFTLLIKCSLNRTSLVQGVANYPHTHGKKLSKKQRLCICGPQTQHTFICRD